MTNLMKIIREAILSGTFDAFRDEFLTSYQPVDDEVRLIQRRKWLEAQNRKGINQR